MDAFCLCCEICAPICNFFSYLPCQCRCCDDYCCCGTCGKDPLDGFWNIPDSDLEILKVHHKPDTYYLITGAKKKHYEVQTGGLLGFQKDVLDAMPSSDRIVFTEVKKGVEQPDPKHEALKLLMKGVQESEAREILGGDKVSLDGLAAQGITTSGQLRARRAKEQS